MFQLRRPDGQAVPQMSFTMFVGRTDGGSSKRTILFSPSVTSHPTEVRWPNSNIGRYQITDKSTADNPVEVTVATQIIFHHVPLECRRGSFKPGATRRFTAAV